MNPAGTDTTHDAGKTVDFFVSYAGVDQAWAEWIADTLERAGRRVLLEAWDFVPGSNWPALVQAGLTTAGRLLAVLTPAYLASVGAAAQWQAIWAADMGGRGRRLIPVQVEPCEPGTLGLLGSLTWIDLTDLAGPGAAAAARARLLDGIRAAVTGQVRSVNPTPLPTRDTRDTRDVPAAADESERAARYPGRPPLVWGLPPELVRNPRFVGRASELAELRARLTGFDRAVPGPGSPVPGVRAQVVHGLGGVGKTELVVEFAYRYSHAYDLVWWIRGDKMTEVVAGLAALAAQLGLAHVEGDEAAAAAAAEALRAGRPHRRWLLVVDNAVIGNAVIGNAVMGNNAGATATNPYLSRLLQAAETAEFGHLVITSRNPDWAGRATATEVAVLPRRDTIDLLRRHRAALEDAEAERLAAAVGDLPLAAEQAGAWLAASGMTVSDYLAALRVETRELLTRGKPDRYPFIVAAAWNLALDEIGPDEPAVVELLQLAGFFGPEPIPLDLFPALVVLGESNGELGESNGEGTLWSALSAACSSPLRWGDVVARLRALGLGKVEQGTITLHRLVQAVLRDRVPTSRHLEFRATVGWLMIRALPTAIQGNPAAWPRWAALLPHLQAQIEAEPSPADANAAGMLGLGNLAALYLQETGQLAAAVDLHTWVLARTEQVVGTDHPNTLVLRNNLALALQKAGRISEAIGLYERILARASRILESDDPNLGISRNNLASAYWAAGRIAEAVELLEQVVDDAGRIRGPDHRDTLLARSNLANAYQTAGRLAEAIRLHEEVLVDVVRVLGQEHLTTFLVRNNLASSYQASGRTTEALDLYEQVLTGREGVLGDNHPDTLLSRSNLADAYQALGRLPEAIDLYERVLSDARGVLGADHPHILITWNNLACAVAAAGRLAEAIDLYERVLADQRRVLGPDHRDTLTSQGNLANAYRAAGRTNADAADGADPADGADAADGAGD
ncbi:toll/interleukin-1 receptor domain-containing protein [Frankia sp. B2]|uniref:FxSxx-COOH system tetratricopeptide repeat protein n=1 Tax=Frankia sp. B2 TaxID=2541730 RepID=UPI00106B02A0|nr:FxSxx-COOH system tetratricopeptide repeat protein [Frankia sp. B2]TFE30973.1 toll/interleukin-1 receptor domain-containing protein [Frankia sp. B2]